MRVIDRREHPHPGATLDAFEIRDGYRYQAFTTNTSRGQLAMLDARHRAHARVEDRIRTGKDTGLGHLPSRHEQINAVWLELALIAADLLALAQSMLLPDEPELARAEPRTLRYRLRTPPPGSPTGNARCSSAWPSTGPGLSRSPEPSNACGSSRFRLDGKHQHLPRHHNEDHGDPGLSAGDAP